MVQHQPKSHWIGSFQVKNSFLLGGSVKFLGILFVRCKTKQNLISRYLRSKGLQIQRNFLILTRYLFLLFQPSNGSSQPTLSCRKQSLPTTRHLCWLRHLQAFCNGARYSLVTNPQLRHTYFKLHTLTCLSHTSSVYLRWCSGQSKLIHPVFFSVLQDLHASQLQNSYILLAATFFNLYLVTCLQMMMF